MLTVRAWFQSQSQGVSKHGFAAFVKTCPAMFGARLRSQYVPKAFDAATPAAATHASFKQFVLALRVLANRRYCDEQPTHAGGSVPSNSRVGDKRRGRTVVSPSNRRAGVRASAPALSAMGRVVRSAKPWRVPPKRQHSEPGVNCVRTEAPHARPAMPTCATASRATARLLPMLARHVFQHRIAAPHRRALVERMVKWIEQTVVVVQWWWRGVLQAQERRETVGQ